eukprot:NODE_35_length_31537_cov_0.293403.p14 type:complete len:173 gc:universal NODE_35_length_31537_cov_0.293403:26794-27312(+)
MQDFLKVRVQPRRSLLNKGEMVDEVSSQSTIDKHKGKLIVDFTATWCGPCKAIAPTFEALSKEFTSLKFVKVDVDKSPDISKKYGVTAMPTFKVIENSVAIDELTGASPSGLRNLCDKHKGTSSFKGKGYTLGGGIRKTSYEPPQFLKNALIFVVPFLAYLILRTVFGLVSK